MKRLIVGLKSSAKAKRLYELYTELVVVVIASSDTPWVTVKPADHLLSYTSVGEAVYLCFFFFFVSLVSMCNVTHLSKARDATH
jgi:hypothetical protein